MQNRVMSWILQAFIVAYEQYLSIVNDLELELVTLFLFVTHPLVMIIICAATLFINPNIDDQVMGRGKQVSLKSMHKVQLQTVTEIFDLET